MLTDTHVHFDGMSAAGDTLDAIVARAAQAGVGRMIAIGGSPVANRAAIKIAQAIPGRREYYFPKGDDAPKVKINCKLYGPNVPGKTDNATAWQHTSISTGVFANTLLKATASEYLEIPVNSYWWVDSNTIKRSGGTFNIFEMELGLIRSFYTINDTARST